MSRRACQRRERGVTLIELIVAIAIIALAGSALLGTLAYLNGTGNTSILQAQAQSIADAYLNEITTKSFDDPNGIDGEGARVLFDDVNDYDGLVDAAAQDQAGNAVGNFRVSVAVVAGGLGALPAAAVYRVDVTVNYGNASTAIATGYRTRYP